MEIFKFEDKPQERRSIFANRICKLLYEKHNGNLDDAIIDGERIFSGFNTYVRNIYELVDSEIPLIAYYELKKYGADNYGFSQAEFEQAIDNTKIACVQYYN